MSGAPKVDYFTDYTKERKRRGKLGDPEIDYCPECGRKGAVSRVTRPDGGFTRIFTHTETTRNIGGIPVSSSDDRHFIVKDGEA